jgi:recombinational DNA repair protein (RecF pathway)
MPDREPCALCGDQDWTQAHFLAGRLICRMCFEGSKPALSMPPNARQRAQIAAWLRPRTSYAA